MEPEFITIKEQVRSDFKVAFQAGDKGFADIENNILYELDDDDYADNYILLFSLANNCFTVWKGSESEWIEIMKRPLIERPNGLNWWDTGEDEWQLFPEKVQLAFAGLTIEKELIGTPKKTKQKST